jgi:hypothetical protein
MGTKVVILVGYLVALIVIGASLWIAQRENAGRQTETGISTALARVGEMAEQGGTRDSVHCAYHPCSLR